MMGFLHIALHFFEWLFFLYLGFASLYIFVFSLAGIYGYKPLREPARKIRKIAVMIPGYKEDNVIVEVARNATQQDYPREQFEVIVIADSFKKDTLEELRKLPVRVIEVNFEQSTKAKALNKAMDTIGDDYQLACILDADNLMQAGFLQRINQAFDDGFIAVQGHRIAKNMNTNMAVLDAISEEVNNHIFRRGHRVLGLSSALIGSGMAFDYSFFKLMMKDIHAVGGFDKELELRMLRMKHQIEFVDDALVLDEKVQKTEVFKNQRKRWLSAQFIYFGRYFRPGVKELFTNGNFDFADKVYQMVQPPRILLLGLLVMISSVYVVMSLWPGEQADTFLFFDAVHWLSLLAISVVAFLFSIPRKFYNRKSLKAIMSLPLSFLIMLTSLFRLRGANRKFIHTTHGTDQ